MAAGALSVAPPARSTLAAAWTATPAVACDHCQSEVPAALRAANGPSFCCAGCRGAYELLHAAGLDDYYGYRARTGGESTRVAPPSGDLAELDAPGYAELYCRRTPEGLAASDLALSGLHCAACVWLLERLPRVAPGVAQARVDFARSSLEVEWDPARTSLSAIARAVARLGYTPSPPRGRAGEQARRAELRGLLIRIGIAGAIAGNVMLMAFALYSGQWGSRVGGAMDAETRRFFEWGSLLASLPSLAAGSLFFRGAWAALRTRTAHMDLPIALGIAAAFGSGAYHTISGSGQSYFDTITVLIFLLLVGRYLQRKHQLAEASAAELIHSVMPAFSRVITDVDGEPRAERVAAESVQVGAVVEVLSGEVVPVDGTVVRGESRLDLSLMTGESMPATVRIGSAAPAGATNLGAPLWLRAERAGHETRVAQLLGAVERATLVRTPIATEANRIAGVFTWTVLATAVLTAALWWTRGPSAALDHALALLIVACPCALAMATPLALSAAAAAAARAHLLFFDMRAVEALARPATVLLDKTGTLTEGRLTLRVVYGDPSAWRIAAAAEAGSSHPVARALEQYVAELDPEPGPAPMPVLLEETAGCGVRADHQGEPLLVGSERFVLAHATLDAEARACLRELPRGASPLYVALAGRVVAIGGITDPIRAGVAPALLALRAAGHRLSLVSGDHPDVVRAVADDLAEQCGDPALFDDVAGGVTPEGKLARVTALQRAAGEPRVRGVIMVGDGVNDAGALAAADVGIAVRGASEASRLAADVFLGAGGVTDLLRLTTGSRRVLRTIRRGMLFSLAYNVVGIGLAVTGLLSPLGAAILMPLSSLTVVSNAYRSRSFDAPKD